MLHNHAVYLRKAKQFADSCVAAEKAVNHLRHLHKQDPDRYQSNFAYALSTYGASLYDDQRIDEACVFLEESVTLRRPLYARDPDRYRSEHAASLHLHSVCLLQARRTDAALNAASAAAVEAVSLGRQLHRLDAEQSSYHLTVLLQHHGICLYETGHIEQACDVEAEAIELLRQLCDHGVGQRSSYIVELKQLIEVHQAHLREAGRIDDINAPELASEESTDSAGRKLSRSPYISYSEVPHPPIDQTAWMPSLENSKPAPPPASTRRRPFAISEILFRLIEVINSLPADHFLAEKPSVEVPSSRSVKTGGGQAVVSASENILADPEPSVVGASPSAYMKSPSGQIVPLGESVSPRASISQIPPSPGRAGLGHGRSSPPGAATAGGHASPIVLVRLSIISGFYLQPLTVCLLSITELVRIPCLSPSPSYTPFRTTATTQCTKHPPPRIGYRGE